MTAPNIKWSKQAPLSFVQETVPKGILVDGRPYLLVAASQGSSATMVQERNGTTVAKHKASMDRVHVDGELVLFVDGQGDNGVLFRATAQGEWIRLASISTSCIGLGGGRLVTSEIHSLGPDGRCTLRVHRVTDTGLELEQTWEDQALLHVATVSQRHLLIHGHKRLLAFELHEGEWTPRPIELPEQRGGSAGLVLASDLACLDAPSGSAKEGTFIDLYRFENGAWTLLESVQNKHFQGWRGEVARLDSGFFVVRNRVAVALRVVNGALLSRAFKHEANFFTDGTQFGVVAAGAIQLYAMNPKRGPGTAKAKAKAAQVLVVVEPEPQLPAPQEWVEQVEELLATHASANTDDQRHRGQNAFNTLLCKVEAAWRVAPGIISWLASLDAQLNAFPDALRMASLGHEEASPATPAFRLVRYARADNNNAESFGVQDHPHLQQLFAEVSGKYTAKLFTKGSQAWTKLDTLVLQNPYGKTSFGDMGLRALSKVPLPSLRRLSLVSSGAGDKGIRAFAKSDCAPGLAQLYLDQLGTYKKGHAGLDATTLGMLGARFSLELLSLAGTDVSDEALAAFLEGPSGDSLRQLHLGNYTNSLRMLEGAPALESVSIGAAAGLSQLPCLGQVLRLKILFEGEVKSADLVALASAFPSLRHLSIYATWSTRPDFSPLLPGLHSLELGGNTFAPEYDDLLEDLVVNAFAAKLRVLTVGNPNNRARDHDNLRGVHIHPFSAKTWAGPDADAPPYADPGPVFASAPDTPFSAYY